MLGVDIDTDALTVAQGNLEAMEMTQDIDLLQMRISEAGIDTTAVRRAVGQFDTVVMSALFSPWHSIEPIVC